MPFLRSYETPQPAPDSERTPEVIEAEMRALELAMDALILLTLKSVCQFSFLYEQLSFVDTIKHVAFVTCLKKIPRICSITPFT